MYFQYSTNKILMKKRSDKSMKLLIIITLSPLLFFTSCTTLYEETNEGCITADRPNHNCPLLPLKSIGELVRDFERIRNNYEISLIDGSEYNLIEELEFFLFKDMEKQAEIFDYNIHIINSRVKHYNNRFFKAFRKPSEENFLTRKVKEYDDYAPKYKTLKHHLSMLIEKLKAIERRAIKEQERKEEKLKEMEQIIL